ncbi:MAG TPA: hypothetical protein VLF71_00075 [Candidatus Saccharimonadales bacterium]|nr:hypothetical protein [Candidatus Saccharimonadales bacterium]
MRKRLLGLKNSTYLVMALALALVGLIPALKGRALAYVQLTSRSIQMSSSAPGVTANQTYKITFTPTTAAKNVRIDFCSNSPLYTDSCTAPTGLDVSGATFTNGSGFTSWAIATGNNSAGTPQPNETANAVTISNSSAYATGSSINFSLGNIKNPTTSPPGTFYARINTYVAQSNDWGSAASPGTVADFGGIALSTANLISITAKVQETLTFCVSGTPQTSTNTTACLAGDITAPTLTLGHGSPATLDSSLVDVASAYTQVSTNASSGISMRLKSANTCSNGGLSSNGGSTCNIPGVTTGSPAGSVAQAITAGSAAFGLYVANSTNNTAGTGTITPDANYHNASHTTISSDLWYGMDQDGSVGVTTTYGDVIATSSAPLSLTNNQLVFAATASLTTQAGIYTVNESIIVTGTF